jgi:hypothetical protein
MNNLLENKGRISLLEPHVKKIPFLHSPGGPGTPFEDVRHQESVHSAHSDNITHCQVPYMRLSQSEEFGMRELGGRLQIGSLLPVGIAAIECCFALHEIWS